MIEFVGINEGLHADEEVWPLDHYWEEPMWFAATRMYHSFAYGIDLRVPNWLSMPKPPINKPRESFEFSKLIISFL